jgi:UDP-sulfoquinovose synthase
VFNQFTESKSVRGIAETVAEAFPGEASIEHVDNPRVEQEDHYYNPKHTALVDLGLKPTLLSSTLIDHMFDVVERHKDRVDLAAIMPTIKWRETHSELPQTAAEFASAG